MALNGPLVSVIVPMRNEEQHVVSCLESLLANDYPHDQLEILVVDGMSRDRSREIVQEYTASHPNVRLLDNRKRIVSSALNIGIQEAKGQIIVRLDAHAVCAPDYVRTCVRLLQTTEAASVGGAQRAVGKDYVSVAMAIGLTTPFGVGNAPFRYAERSSWVDTVYLGAWHRSTLESLGGFDEDWVINQDYELNVRLRQAGGKLLLSPDLRCWYHVRPTLKELARQWLRYGFWRVKTLVAHPDSLQWRQLAPPALVAAVIVSLALLPLHWPLGMIVPALYVSANLLSAVWTAWRRGWKYLPLLPLVFATIHLSWGAGFLAGLVKWGVPRITLRSLLRAFESQEAA
jgi:cellulose synthase/poly-beta-1,6-N-acetylglucosamine synthase-like glycosyltransferase